MVWLTLAPLFILLGTIAGSLLSLVMQLDITTLLGLLGQQELRFALLMSLGTSLCSLLLALLIGIPAAWAMTRLRFPCQRLVNTLMDLPMVTPPLVVGIGLLLLFGQRGPIAPWFPAAAQLLFSPAGVIVAQTYVASAIVLRSAHAAFSALNPGYLHTAYNLGLTPLQTLWLVEIPLCRHALLSGSVLALARALGEFGATLMLAGAVRLKTETLPIAIYLNIASGDFNLAIACALLLMLFASILLLLLHRLQAKGGT